VNKDIEYLYLFIILGVSDFGYVGEIRLCLFKKLRPLWFVIQLIFKNNI